jgi:cytochrome b6-f complex iron-sulfur subunit
VRSSTGGSYPTRLSGCDNPAEQERAGNERFEMNTSKIGSFLDDSLNYLRRRYLRAGAEREVPDEIRKVRRRMVVASMLGFLGVDFLMFLRFFFPRVLYEPSTVFTVGIPADFTGGVDTGFVDKDRIWMVRDTDGLFAIYARCTHLGCTPNWMPSENKFKCPCHGSGYDAEGVNFEGPAPRPMDRAYISLLPTGVIQIDTSRLFQYGHWDDPGAILRVN